MQKNKEVVKSLWHGTGEGRIHDRAGQSLEALMAHTLSSGSLDNITGVLVCLSNFDR